MQEDKKIVDRGDILEVIWYIDSGCSKHMTYERRLLSNYQTIDGPRVMFGDNNYGLTKGEGTLMIGDVQVQEF